VTSTSGSEIFDVLSGFKPRPFVTALKPRLKLSEGNETAKQLTQS